MIFSTVLNRFGSKERTDVPTDVVDPVWIQMTWMVNILTMAEPIVSYYAYQLVRNDYFWIEDYLTQWWFHLKTTMKLKIIDLLWLGQKNNFCLLRSDCWFSGFQVKISSFPI